MGGRTHLSDSRLHPRVVWCRERRRETARQQPHPPRMGLELVKLGEADRARISAYVGWHVAGVSK